jgi:hypothetical protein
VITGQVAPAVDLEDKLPERQGALRIQSWAQMDDLKAETEVPGSPSTMPIRCIYVRVFDVIDIILRVTRQVAIVGHITSSA